MSEFIEVEWFGRASKIGIVLTYDEHDGFKARMAPLPFKATLHGTTEGGLEIIERSEDDDIKWLMENAAKVPFDWAWGIFGPRMRSEWGIRHMVEKPEVIRYHRRDYDIKTLQDVGAPVGSEEWKVTREVDDPTALRLSIGGVAGELGYVVYRGDTGECVTLLRKALGKLDAHYRGQGE